MDRADPFSVADCSQSYAVPAGGITGGDRLETLRPRAREPPIRTSGMRSSVFDELGAQICRETPREELFPPGVTSTAITR